MKTQSPFSSDEQLYILANHWKEDLAFYEEELIFLKHLVEKDQKSAQKPDQQESLTLLHAQVSAMQLEVYAMGTQLQSHLTDYADLEMKVLDQNEKSFREGHAKIEPKYAQLVKDYRALKRTIFEISKAIMKG